MKIGDYVRTNKGTIDKLTEENINDYKISLLYEGEKLINWSENIIDLIEVGDYVNGMEIIDTSSHYYKLVTNLIDDNVKEGLKNVFINNEKDIKSIVTKEIFESMEYKL